MASLNAISHDYSCLFEEDDDDDVVVFSDFLTSNATISIYT